MEANEAQLLITWNGAFGQLPDPVNYDLNDVALRQIAAEAVGAGGVPGIAADPGANFTDFVIDRFPATGDRPFNSVQIRPKTPFGA